MPSPKVFAGLTDDALAPLRALFDARVPSEGKGSWWVVPPGSSFEDYLQAVGSQLEDVLEGPVALESKVWNTATLEGIAGLIVDVKDEATARVKVRETVHDILTSDVHQKALATDIKKKAQALARKLPVAAPVATAEVTKTLQVLLREISDWKISRWLSDRQQEMDRPRLRALYKIKTRLGTEWISGNWARIGPLLVAHRSQRPDEAAHGFQEWQAEERRLLTEFHRQPPSRELQEEAERELKRMQTSSSLTEAQSRATGRTPRPDREGKRLVAGHFDSDTAEKIKDLARARRTTVQAILEEAVSDLFAKYEHQVVAIEKFAKDFNKS